MKWLLLAAGVLSPSFHATDVWACGCFAPPIPQPDVQGNFAVNQRAEQIIFEVSEGFVSAHVRILYQGDPEQFAWLLPMPSVPEIELSETDLFGYVDQQTAPVVNFTSANLCPAQNYVCRSHPPCPTFTPTEAFSPPAPAASGAPIGFANDEPGPSGPGSAPPVTVLASARVGSYDTITFAAEEADLAIQWLNDNGFIVNETMSPYMQPYLDGGLVFVASKLIPGADLDEIRPLKLRYEADVPSIPLRLTAIAAEPHMTVTAFIYASEAFDPVVAPLVEVPQQDLSFASGRSNYPMVLARSVDEMGGFAFVREYVGPGPRFQDTTGCCTTVGARASRQERPAPAAATDGGATTDAGSAGAGVADGGPVEDAGAPVVDADPDPQPVTPEDPGFGDVCLVAGDGLCQCPLADFDAVDCSEGLVAGLSKANELADTYPVLTRLTSRISPEEMVEDPIFEPTDASLLPARLTLTGVTNTLTSCEAQIEDTERYERILEDQACTALYCDWGECVLTDQGAGCRCDEGFVARLFTDTDGQPSFSCVPETPPVDFAAGGLDLPSACEGNTPREGECVDLGGFAGLRCEQDEAAAIALPVIGAAELTCASLTRSTSSPGASNYSRELEELDVCAPAPPACRADGWLEELGVSNPGKDCGDGPDPSWFVKPPAPVCPDPPAPNAAASGTPNAFGTPNTAATATLPEMMDTREPRPGAATAKDDGCSVGVGTRTGSGSWAFLALSLGFLMSLRRHRRRWSHD